MWDNVIDAHTHNTHKYLFLWIIDESSRGKCDKCENISPSEWADVVPTSWTFRKLISKLGWRQDREHVNKYIKITSFKTRNSLLKFGRTFHPRTHTDIHQGRATATRRTGNGTEEVERMCYFKKASMHHRINKPVVIFLVCLLYWWIDLYPLICTTIIYKIVFISSRSRSGWICEADFHLAKYFSYLQVHFYEKFKSLNKTWDGRRCAEGGNVRTI